MPGKNRLFKIVNMNAIKTYIRESFEELSKVTWPTKNQSVRLTIIVLASCLAFGILLGFLDYIFNEMFVYVISR